jgi:long-chain acyl-CoA synthetase
MPRPTQVLFERQRPASEAGWFWGIARERPEALAVVDADERRWTFGQLADLVDRLSRGLSRAGLGDGDVITVVLRNCVEYLALELAVGQSGIYLVPAATALTSDELTHLITDSGSSLVFADAATAPTALGAAASSGLPATRVIGVGAPEGTVDLADFLAGLPASPPTERAAGRYLYYTAGTTGSPKGVLVPRSLVTPEEDADNWVPPFAEAFGFEPFRGVHLVTGPLYHRGPGIWALVTLHLGHTIVLMRRFDPTRMLHLVECYGVTSSHIVPTVFHRMLQLPQEAREAYDLSSLEQVLHAAAPCPVHVKRAMTDWFGPVLWEYYGSTEGGGTMVRPDEWDAHPGSVGRPWPNAAIRITDEQRSPVPAGTEGTIWISNGTSFTYRGDEQKTRDSWDGDWFTVGDIGHVDAEGWLYLGDRRADLIISGGVNVYPAEVEGVLLAHPEVADAAVFGVPDDEWGQRVAAVIEPRPGTRPDDAFRDALVAHGREHLAGYKVPRDISFVAAMPRNEIGKVSRRRLRDSVLSDPVRQPDTVRIPTAPSDRSATT